jgi:hypothetical protein
MNKLGNPQRLGNASEFLLRLFRAVGVRGLKEQQGQIICPGLGETKRIVSNEAK